jgi:hypothetical protein
MRNSVLYGGGAAVVLAFAASAAGAGMPSYGAAPGQCGPGGCGTPGPVGFGPGQVTNEDYPPNAAPGQCFTKVLAPEVTEAVSEHVLVSPEKTELRVIPGTCHMEDKSVLVKEESVELVTIPAAFRTVNETVVVKPGYTRTETVPAVYETITEQVKVKDGYTAWRPGATVAGYAPGAANSYSAGATSRPPGTSGAGVIDHNPAYGGMPTRVLPTGEVLCLVEVPPEYRTITKQVLKSPARTVEIPVPPEVRSITRQVVDVPAHVEKRLIPALFETVKIKVCTGDSTQPYTIPAVYNDYTRIKVITPSRFEWKQVDCRTDVVHAEGGGYIAPPPPVNHYGEQPPPRRHYRPAPRPSYGALPPVHGKQCHTTTTCDDASTPAGYAPPPASYAPPKPAYTKSELSETAESASRAPETVYVASNGGGDQAVANLQAALTSRGYYAGPRNGLFTQDTMRAMVRYQEDNHLAAGRYTGETANALGIASR